MSAISAAAAKVIIACEVTSQATYDALYARPTWPGGASGVTIGIGYDCGYADPARVRADWGELLPAAAVQRLAQVAGVTGDKARTAAIALRDIAVPWAAAVTVFEGRTLPQTASLVASAFPGAEALPDDAFGALASLVYNRGASVASPDGRRVEMGLIRDALAEGRARDVPAYIRGMKRLWPKGAGLDGLRQRRDIEAALFEVGLDQGNTANG